MKGLVPSARLCSLCLGHTNRRMTGGTILVGDVQLWHFLLQIVILYVLVMLSLRLMGKREIGQLSVFDFVVSVMIAELSTLPMEDTKVSIFRSIIAIAALVVLQIFVAWLSLHSHRFRHLVEGEPSVLVEHGRINDVEMKRTRYSMHDLLMQMREKGVGNVADVELAILETSGKLSVFPRAEARPITPGDLGLRAKENGLPMPLIIDGQPVRKTLDILQRDVSWLNAELSRKGYGPVETVFFAAIDAHGVIRVDPMDNEHGEHHV